MTAINEVQTKLMNGFGVVTQPNQVCRLGPETRRLAARFISGEFGAAMRKADFALDQTMIAGCSADMTYAAAVLQVAANAPIRILPDEKLVGAATLFEASCHVTPLLKDVCSTSHTTIGFESALKTGYKGLRQRIETRLTQGGLDDNQRDFLKAMLQCLNAAGIWHERHMEFLRDRIRENQGVQKQHYENVLAHLQNVPENPPVSFREAVQALWFMWSFQRLCGNWSGIGRIDKMLGPCLKNDLEAGRLTLDEARELLAHFWIKGCEWIGRDELVSSGDAQNYQNIVLAGIDEHGKSVINDVTYLVLDVVEELHISDFPVAVRVNCNTPEKLLRRIAEVQRLGGGIVSIYNEDLILRALTKFGYSIEEARNFANDGCWEIIIPGKTAFSYQPFDMLKLLQNAIGLGPGSAVQREFHAFEALYQAFLNELDLEIKSLHAIVDSAFQPARTPADKAVSWNGHPAPLLSVFVEDCIEKARGYYNLGARYSVEALHAGGIPDTANSLFVLKKLVYDEQRFSLRQFVDILKADWAGHEALRQEIRNRFELYGNDNAEADAMIRRVYDDYVRIGGQIRERNSVLRPLGISTFGREVADFLPDRMATAFGTHKGDILATNCAPTPGTDHKGPTAVIRSFCSMDFEKLPNGVPLELKIMPSSVAGESGLNALVSILRTFVKLGGFYLHVDVVDNRILREAQQHPEKFPNLSVRVSGWSARFVKLDHNWQEMIIRRTQQTIR